MLPPDQTCQTFHACPAQAFAVEFGVFRGEAMQRLEDLNPGDIYRLKTDTTWRPVTADDEVLSGFTREIAANVAAEKMVSLAHLIFMTTEGRRADVMLVTGNGRHFLVSATCLASGPEYVLIDIQTRDVAFEPVLVPAPVAPSVPRKANVVTLRAAG